MAKHEIIYKELRAEIAAGKYQSSNQLPSEAQLVDRFEVSRPTVARALRELQTEGLIKRRAGSGTFINPSSSTRSAAPVLGLLVPERGVTEIFEAICGELGALARVQGYGVLWGDSPIPFVDRDSSPEHALLVCQRFIQEGVAGVFFSPMEYGEDKDRVNRELIELLSQSGIPVVLLDRDVSKFPQRSAFDLVSMDNFNAGFIIAEHMIRLGCRKLRFIARPGSATTVDARLSGIREALTRYEYKPNENLTAYGDPQDPHFVKQLHAGRSCDGILCANDLTAAQLLTSLSKLNINVPDKVRVAGIDDVRNATLFSVPLTTVHQPCQEIANVAFNTMQERIRKPSTPARTIMLSPRLVVRESCGAYKIKK
jgi:LacI family transcriptional regulator